MKLEINTQFEKSIELLENSKKNLFITGRAGTGKSTLLKYFVENTNKKVVILAPTGVAAINAGGQTIHSFFGFRPDITLEKVKIVDKGNIYKQIDMIIVDEISMVRADLLDCMNKFLKLNGKDANKCFGGVQMVFIGDLYQLPPVVTSQDRESFYDLYETPYFFSAKVFNDDFDMEIVELQTIYRQKDTDFIDILNAIRNKSFSDLDLDNLNKRHIEDEIMDEKMYIYLTGLNRKADEINQEKLSEIKSKSHIFRAIVKGEIDKSYYPTGEELELKKGAQIMLLNNDRDDRWVNGTIGNVVGFSKYYDQEEEQEIQSILIELDNENIVEVLPYTWEVYKFFMEDKKLKSKSIGSFTQYPIRLAFAITIHKSQGKTFDKVILDPTGIFENGQMYVALSRCRTIEGLVLKEKIKSSHVRIDFNIIKFLTRYQYKKSNENMDLDSKIEMIQNAIKNKESLKMVYLKAKDEKSERIIKPKKISEMEFKGKSFLGLDAFCTKRKENRVFNVERILELEVVN